MNSNEYPRILILSDATWADDNNIGNTFSNLFESWPKDKIAMIYARPDLPNTVVCDNFFQISENRIIKRFLNAKIKTGKKINSFEFENYETKQTFQNEETFGKKVYSFFLKYRLNIFLVARECLWKIGKWETKELEEFIDEFSPEIVLSLACPGIYMNRIQQYVIHRSQAKSIVYFVDDVYSLKQLSFSPIFWINKLILRRSIKKTVKLSSLVYTIVPKQKYEYDKSFNIETQLLTKGGIFKEISSIELKYQKSIKLVYTGNIYAGRWETLKEIGKALDQVNKTDTKGILYIYTRNGLTAKMKESLLEINSIKFMGGIPASQVSIVQSEADILVHVESLCLKERLLTRLSFSTKLVDYFSQGKCILAVGWNEAASIEYLKKNDIAVIVDDLNKVSIILNELLNEQEIISRYGFKSWRFGKENHDIFTIKESFRQDMVDLIVPKKCNR